MMSGRCEDQIRYRLTDESGRLRFDDIQLDDARCEGTFNSIRSYIKGRPLSEVDRARIAELTSSCPDACTQGLLAAIDNLQTLFLAKEDPS